MCRAFSCLVNAGAEVTWKFGVDSHTELVKLAGYKDRTADPAQMTFARVEITPKNKSYLAPDEWVLRVDESITPKWFGELSRVACFSAHKKWLAQLNKILVRKEVIHPFKIDPPKKITAKHIAILKKWASVWDSVGDSVWASVGDSVWDSVRASVRASVWDSVWDSVRASVGAYTGSFFVIPNWKYVKHPKGKYPFEPCVKLWEQGLVPSFDGTTWRLHGKNGVAFKITAEKLRGGT